MSKVPPSNPTPPDQNPDAHLLALEDEVWALRLALSVSLGEQRLKREDGKEWLASLKATALAGLSKSKAAQAGRVADRVSKFFDGIEQGISLFIRRRTTN